MSCSHRKTLQVAVLLYCTLSAAFLAAQTELNQVHILPRINPAPSTVESSLVSVVGESHTALIRRDVDLVMVPVIITDNMGRLVTGLQKQNFKVFEEKQDQEIRSFSNEDAPISVGIILDTSGSMDTKIARAKEAVTEFCQTANPQDEFFLITFSDTPDSDGGFTSDPQEIQNKLAFITPKGNTSLLDAVYLGTQKMRHATQPRKALLVISDGGDNHSRYTENEIKSAVQEADVTLFSIGIYDRYFPTPEERLGPQLMSDLAQATGGQSFTLDNPNDLPLVANQIGRELRDQYVLAYHPKNTAHDGRWHRIKVKLMLPKGLPSLIIHAKNGYYASSE